MGWYAFFEMHRIDWVSWYRLECQLAVKECGFRFMYAAVELSMFQVQCQPLISAAWNMEFRY